MFADVLVFQPGMYQAFTYRIPEGESLLSGDLVAVPFGKMNRMKKGLVISIADINQSEYQAKTILGKFPQKYALSRERMELLLWMREEYFSPFYETARLFFPEYAFDSFEIIDLDSQAAIKEGAPVAICREMDHYQLAIQEKPKPKKLLECEVRLALPKTRPSNRAKKQLRIFERLDQENNWIPVAQLIKAVDMKNPAILQTMAKAGILELQEIDETDELPLAQQEVHALTQQQQSILESILKAKAESPILLHGITGSGKTEIYFHFIDEVLMKGKSVLYLIPEIALTPQMIDRIQRRFFASVAVLHSRLSIKERKDAWRMIRNNQVSIVLGTRSAMFAPIENLGAIVVDECHDRSYHAQSSPRFRADEVAIQMGRLYRIPVLLGSATPSFEQYHTAKSGDVQYLALQERAQSAELPEVEIVDLREELKTGNRSMISRSLYQRMKETLARKEQVILFLNRRGFSGFISCRACGDALKCSHCDVSLTYHHEDGSLRCHLCGRRFPRMRTCPSCGSTWLKPFSAGTQKLEAIVQRAFPDANILRMDYDTTRSKESFQEIYESVKAGACDIVIGTQMVTKGWDFPHVTLIGVLAADLSLHTSHYDAADRTFQLLDQVSGRAGRGEKPGYVVLQTYTPEHYAIHAVANHESEWYYTNEGEVRKALRFPPFGHLLTVFGVSRKASQLESGIESARNMFLDKMNQSSEIRDVQIGETIPSKISKADGYFRKEFIIRIPVDQIQAFRACYFKEIEISLIGLRSQGCQISVLWNEEA